jgi:hypothetical protein
MKYDKTDLGFLAGAALFAGFMVVTLGIFFLPSRYLVTVPLLCRGTVEVERHDYSFGPGHGGNYVEVHCRNDSGSREEITIRAVGLVCLSVSAIIFAALFVWLRNSGRIPDGPGKKALAEEWVRQSFIEKPIEIQALAEKKAQLDKLKNELKKELDRGHISREEYEARRTNLLND